MDNMNTELHSELRQRDACRKDLDNLYKERAESNKKMKRAETFWKVVLVVFALSYVSFVGYVIGRDSARTDAAKHNVGHYELDKKSGDKLFVWDAIKN